MWHPLKTVADSRYIALDKFVAYVMAHHADKVISPGLLSTWDIDEVVNGYRAEIGTETDEADRASIIQSKMKRTMTTGPLKDNEND
jgi:hypothetical protein